MENRWFPVLVDQPPWWSAFKSSWSRNLSRQPPIFSTSGSNTGDRIDLIVGIRCQLSNINLCNCISDLAYGRQIARKTSKIQVNSSIKIRAEDHKLMWRRELLCWPMKPLLDFWGFLSLIFLVSLIFSYPKQGRPTPLADLGINSPPLSSCQVG